MLDAVSQALIGAARGWDGGEPNAALKKATSLFLARAAQDHSVLARIGPSLADLDPGAAAWVALACGMAVESGADAAHSGRAVVDLLKSWFPGLPGANESPTAEQAKLLKPIEYLGQAVVSHLARWPELREQLANDPALIERLDDLGAHSFGPIWVREALLKSSGTLLLIHPTSGAGLRIRYTNVSNCFHLFSLLQIAVGQRLEGGRVPDEAVAQAAKGDRGGDATDEAWWHYGDPASRKADIGRSVPGERPPRDLPVVDGEQVILAWPHLQEARTWDASYFRPHLQAMPADAVIEGELTADEVAAWLKRLGITSAQRRWRWPWSRRTT